MPRKSVWEMNFLERFHHSIAAKTFRAIILFSLIISTAAVTFGFALYSSTVNREYRIMTWRAAESAAEAIDVDEVKREAEFVLSVYDSLSEEERQNPEDPSYQAKFAEVRTEAFEDFREKLLRLMNGNHAIAAYTAAIDEENKRMVFIADADPKSTFCPPGTWDPLDHGETDAFLYGAKPSILDQLYDTGAMPATVTNIAKYGYRCTAGKELFKVGKYTVFVFFDNDMNQVADVSRNFLIQYVLLLLIVTLVVLFFSMRQLKKTSVGPINKMASAAARYIQDRQNGRTGENYFGNLDIHTGDEIENLSLTMEAMEKDAAEYVANLARITAEKERVTTELTLANRIQADMLPNIFPAFPERDEFDIYASMDPAKEVGGDFYDFFLIDPDHLGIVMADVSGKGVPAALFMMVSKILVQNYAMTGRTPKEVLEKVNEQICKNNREEMFVTVWFGILDLETGSLTAANAGHEYPILKQPDGKFEVIRDRHGFVIGGMDGVVYRNYVLHLEQGAKLFLYTDGVPESMNNAKEQFGIERTVEALNRKAEDSPEDILKEVDRSVKEFVGDADPFDDLTMLCVHYIGKRGAQMKEMTTEASVDSLANVLRFIDTELEEAGCSMKTQMQIDVAVEELFVNIASYAYLNGSGNAVIGIRIDPESGEAFIRMTDTGIPYNPLEKADPDVTLSAEDREIGGLGIFMAKKSMDDMEYERTDGKNIVTIRKNIKG